MASTRNGLACERKIKTQQTHVALILCFSAALLLWLLAAPSLFADVGGQTNSVISQTPDPNKGPSEFNHHVAGWALIGVGVLTLASLRFPDFKVHRHLWPALFVLAGLFLALWSDGEIWPRGNLNWMWLLQHDAEARQHKIYALLLIAIGIIEYIRIRGSLPRFWKTWAFPILAIIGAGMLTIHDHSSGSGARSPEAQAYLVNPALDVDGRPRAINSMQSESKPDDHSHSSHHPSQPESNSAAMDSMEQPMDHSQMAMPMSAGDTAPSEHHHIMTASMLLVEREHMWFMVVGLAIGLFKFISDGEFFRNRLMPYIWPSCMVLLGLMLTYYRE